MDLNKLDVDKAADQGAALTILHPTTKEPLIDEASGEPVIILLVGKDSAKFKQQSRALTNKRLERRQRLGKDDFTAESVEASALDLLVASTIGFQHIIVDSRELMYSPENVRMLYTRFSWIREQVDEFIADRSNFLKNS